MYEGAARVYFIFAGTSKKSEMLQIIWLNVEGTRHFIKDAKIETYSIYQSIKYGFKTDLSTPKVIFFTPCLKFYYL